MNKAIQSLQNFLKYLTSAWGLLSVFTPIFPLFGDFSHLLPSPEWHSELFTLLATICGLFVVLYEFSCREQNMSLAREDKAGWHFFFGILAVIIYVVIFFPVTQAKIQLELGSFKIILEAVVYIGIFYLLTKGFTILAVQELGKTKILFKDNNQ
jgi:hypothetical protein